LRNEQGVFDAARPHSGFGRKRRIGLVKETVRQTKRGFHVKGGLGREPFTLRQLGHSRHVRSQSQRDILRAYRIHQKLERSCLENGGSLSRNDSGYQASLADVP
jgi:hypothetical protein